VQARLRSPLARAGKQGSHRGQLERRPVMDETALKRAFRPGLNLGFRPGSSRW